MPSLSDFLPTFMRETTPVQITEEIVQFGQEISPGEKSGPIGSIDRGVSG